MIRVKLLILSVTLLLMFDVAAQVSINLDSLSGSIVNGTEIQFDSDDSPSGHHMYDFYVTNNTGTEQSFIITRKSIAEPVGWFNYLCWDLCYNPSPYELWSSNPSTLGADQSKFFSTYVTSPTVENGHYRYYVSTDGMNYIDSVDVTISAISVGVYENNLSALNVFPNPASNNITISQGTSSPLRFMIYDNSGRLVLSTTIENAASSINISQLKSGFYFYTIIDSKNGQSFSSKLVIEK